MMDLPKEPVLLPSGRRSYAGWLRVKRLNDYAVSHDVWWWEDYEVAYLLTANLVPVWGTFVKRARPELPSWPVGSRRSVLSSGSEPSGNRLLCKQRT